MNFERIQYSELNAKQKEIYNFQKVAALLADFGFNCIKLTDDWHGADFLAYHKDGRETLRVQLKARVNIERKYLGKELFLTFPIKGIWYLIPHDELVQLVGEKTNWLETDSWRVKGSYSSGNPGKSLIAALSHARLGSNDMGERTR